MRDEIIDDLMQFKIINKRAEANLSLVKAKREIKSRKGRQDILMLK